MKIFLSAMDSTDTEKSLLSPYFSKEQNITKSILNNQFSKYNLMSFYYINKKKDRYFVDAVKEVSELMLIDSGAHTFQFGKKIDFNDFLNKYIEFIKSFDAPNVLGYFELDIENIIGLNKVNEYRKRLEEVTDKIIPVWHKNRGIDNYFEMLEQYKGKTIAIGGFRETDIRDDQYLMFMKEAKKYNCKVHCLGMTRTKVLDKVPFDYTDSASWLNKAIYGRIEGGHCSKEYTKMHHVESFAFAFKQGIEMQEAYYKKWKKVCND